MYNGNGSCDRDDALGSQPDEHLQETLDPTSSASGVRPGAYPLASQSHG